MVVFFKPHNKNSALCCQKTCLQQRSKCASLGLAAGGVLGTMTTSLLFSEVAGLATCLPGILLLFSALSTAISAASALVNDLAEVLL